MREGGERWTKKLGLLHSRSRLPTRLSKGACLARAQLKPRLEEGGVLENESHTLCLGNPGRSRWALRGSVTVPWEWLSQRGASQGAWAKTPSGLKRAAAKGVRGASPSSPPQHSYPLPATPPQPGRSAGSPSPDSREGKEGTRSPSIVWEGGEKLRPPGGGEGRRKGERRGEEERRGKRGGGEMES